MIQAVIISQNLLNPGFNSKYKVSDVDIASALSSIIEQTGKPVNFASKFEGEYVFNESKDPKAYILDHINEFKSEGGILLFLYSVIVTKGVEQIKKEIQMSHGEPPLIDKPHYICTTDLMILLMSGVANGNVGAFDPMGNEFKIQTKLGIGMLSSAVIEAKIPINEGLLNPC